MVDLRETLLNKLLQLLLEFGYMSRQGFAEWRIVLENHKITRIEFTDKEKF